MADDSLKTLLGSRLAAAVVFAGIVATTTLWISSTGRSEVVEAIREDNGLEAQTYATKGDAAELAKIIERLSATMAAIERRVDRNERAIDEARRATASPERPR